MPRYIYIAKSQPYKTIQGDIEAESEAQVIDKLTKLGYFPISIKAEGLSLDKPRIWLFRKVPNRDIVLFTLQLSSLLEAGVNIINGLHIISNQTSNKYVKAIISDVSSKIKDGESLSESLASYPQLFSNLYTSMIYSGEVGGNIEVTLKRLADFLGKEEEFKNSIRAALTYPAFVFAVGLLTVTILLYFVIPRLATMFTDMGQVLPLPTRILINTSNSLREFGWIILTIIFLFIFFLRRAYRSAGGRILWDRVKLRILILGEIILKTEISRLMRTLSLLLSSGIPITPALEISISSMENQILKSEVKKFKEQIAKGTSLSSALKNSKLFPEFVNNIVAIGEETGTLDKSLMRIANDYEQAVDRTLKTLSRLLEPVIILVMGLIIGFIVLSMLLPIFQINLIVR